MDNCCCDLRRLAALSLAAVLALGAAGLALGGCANRGGKEAPAKKDQGGKGSWLMFGGTPSRNMVNLTDTKIATDWKVEGGRKNIQWVAKCGSRTYGGPVIAGGQIYVGTNNDNPHDPKVKGPRAVLMCFRQADGKFLWQLAHKMPPPGIVREALKDGLCSTPAIEGNRLYYVTPAAEVICASTRGKVLWSFDMMKKLKVSPCFVSNCSPLIAGDLLYVVTGNGRDGDNQLPSPKAPSFLALNKKTGKVAWKKDSPGANILEGQWSNPAYAKVKGKGQVVFPGGDGWLYSFEAKTGKLLWKFDCNLKGATWKKRPGREPRNYIVSTPVIYQNRVYVGTGLYPGGHPRGNNDPSHFWCVGMTRTGDVSPTLVTDAKANPPKTKKNPNSALLWHFGGMIKPPPQDSREYYLGQTISTCAVHDGLVYLAELDGFLHCFDAKTGTKCWEHDLKSGIWGSPYWVDGKIYLGDDDGDVLIFKHGRKKDKLAQIEMGDSVLSTPVAANGVLYVLARSKLYAIKK
jgi:outer membrane protein assembly factor BamB